MRIFKILSATLLLTYASMGAMAAPAQHGDRPFLPTPPKFAYPDDPLVQFLSLVQYASENLDYSGIYTWQRGDKVMSSQITHIVDGEGVKERILVLDGKHREFVRLNDRFECLMPEYKRKVRIVSRSNQFPAILVEPVSELGRYYTLDRSEKTSRVAGIDCVEYDIKPRYHDRNAFHICVEDKNKLMLKFQRLTHKGDLIEQIMFTKLIVGKDVPVNEVGTKYDTRKWEEVNHVIRSQPAVDLTGWRIKTPSGFNLVKTKGMSQDKHHLLFSDGMTTFSIFVQKLQPNEIEMPHHDYKVMGKVNIYRERADQFWVTAVGDMPMGVLKKMATSAKYVPPVSLTE